ncbi:replicative DNA helicase [Rickettsiales endosymbiont of Stachyamoeba lipophora]|uniref:replicative DNA helicase n=1 Tax=Rickettsiales endosymbiont of Stachyamoeba lipophora TaxID=2486578 RepID=UPI000F646D2A|nr:replicative DNA helicase [Rickettsiales endosymbiont of Stachyamoeba lipophora]AZL15922.1 replicative DNA helicase [Rickettsiales endosymbiont of Stachyamoeba lipophora]
MEAFKLIRNEPEAKQMPQNLLAEQMMLGGLLIDNNIINQVADFLESKHFYLPIHQRIYQAIYNLVDKGLIANPVVLKNLFDRDEALKEEDGAEYLNRIAALASSEFYFVDYAKHIFDLSLKRELIEIAQKAMHQAYSHEEMESAFQQIEQIEQSLFRLATQGNAESNVQKLSKGLELVIKKTEKLYQSGSKISGVSTGFNSVDYYLGGFQDSDLIILAARPSMGKTALAMNFAYNVAQNYFAQHQQNSEEPLKGVAFFSLEMSGEQLAQRLLSMASEIFSQNINKGALSHEQFDKLQHTVATIKHLPIFIDDTPALTISALKTRARRMKRQHNVSMIFVDYLQLLRGVGSSKERNRVQEISEITQGLKAIAKEINVPVMALSQLSRDVEKREDKRPLLSDLRESGSIEQDADIVMFIYRESYYLDRKKGKQDTEHRNSAEFQHEETIAQKTADVIIAKHRSGPIGDAKLCFDAALTKFSDFNRNSI